MFPPLFTCYLHLVGNDQITSFLSTLREKTFSNFVFQCKIASIQHSPHLTAAIFIWLMHKWEQLLLQASNSFTHLRPPSSPLQISSSWTRFQLKRFFFLPLSLSLPYWKKTSPSFIELLIIMVILSGGFRYQHEVCFGASGGEGNWVTVTVTEFLSFASIL